MRLQRQPGETMQEWLQRMLDAHDQEPPASRNNPNQLELFLHIEDDDELETNDQHHHKPEQRYQPGTLPLESLSFTRHQGRMGTQ